MPTAMLKAMAKEYGVPLATVEAHWAECKAGIKPGEGGKGWGLVTDCVKEKCSRHGAKATAAKHIKKMDGKKPMM